MAARLGRTVGRTIGGGGAGEAQQRPYDEGLRLFDEGRFEDAIRELRIVLDDADRDPVTERVARFYLAEAYIAIARAHLDSGDDAAVENLHEAVAFCPGYADLHFLLGWTLLSRGDFVAASPCLRQALAINPNYARATLALGIASYLQHDFAEGLRLAQSALALDPTLRRTALQEAVSANAHDDHAAAVEALKRMADTEGGDDTQTHVRLGQDLFRDGLYEAAAEEYQMAIDINPGYADLRNQLGVVLLALGQDESAVTEFDEALAINSRYIDAHVNRARALLRLGRADDARAAYWKVLEIEPGNVAALEGLAPLL